MLAIDLLNYRVCFKLFILILISTALIEIFHTTISFDYETCWSIAFHILNDLKQKLQEVISSL